MLRKKEVDSSKLWWQRACKVMPGGVNSPVRAFGSVGGSPRFIRSAAGCYLTDVQGNRLIDYIGSWGAMILGHAQPHVVESVQRTVQDGTSFGTSHPLEVELAEEIIARIPSVEMVRMVNSGTEAVMSAIRLARAVTGREKIVKFEGGYHGHADALLVKAGSGAATLGLPGSAGVTSGVVQSTLVSPYNDLPSVETLFREAGKEIAAVIVEPVAGNMGVVPPAEGFLQGLRTLTKACGALLIFDEVITGFRLARGGAQQLYGVSPDLTTLGKIIGGGLPVGAYGGPAEMMKQVAPQGPVYQAGTLSGNPPAMAAGLATLQQLDETAYTRLEQTSRQLAQGLTEAIQQAGVHGTVQRVGSMMTLFLGVDQVCNFADAQRADHQRFASFFQAMLKRGVHLPPSGYEAWFISTAHDFTAIEQTLQYAREALACM